MTRTPYDQAPDELLSRASLCSEHARSVRMLQDALGITEASMADLQFGGTDPIHGLPYEEAWPLLTPRERREELLAYLRTEEAFREDEAPGASVVANDA